MAHNHRDQCVVAAENGDFAEARERTVQTRELVLQGVREAGMAQWLAEHEGIRADN
jgi:hypothetical protein